MGARNPHRQHTRREQGMKVVEHEPYKPTEYLKLRYGWLRVRPKQESKRRLRIEKREKLKAELTRIDKARAFKKANKDFFEKGGHRVRRRARDKARKMLRRRKMLQ